MSNVIPQLDVVKIPHSKLIKNSTNRTVKRDAGNVKRRAAHILKMGILQNIVVTPLPDKEGFYQIEAGEGRYESVELLIREGKADADTFLYPAMVADASNLADLIKLAENSNRDDLHPVDEFLTYQSAVESGNDIKEVAVTNGVTLKYVKQRLQLAKLSPYLLDMLRSSQLPLESAEVFTLVEDHERQDNVFKSLTKWDRENPSAIKTILLAEKISSMHPLAQFVGKDAYRKAGGSVTSSLFDDTEVYENPDLLRKLALAQLQDAAKKLKGWSWVEVTTESPYNELYQSTSGLIPTGKSIPKALQKEAQALEEEADKLNALDDLTQEQDKRLDEIWERLDAISDEEEHYNQYDKKEMAVAGCIVGIENGRLGISLGRVKPEDLPKLAALKSKEEAKSDNEQVVLTPQVKTESSEDYTQALTQDMSSTRTALLQAQLAEHPDLAYDLGVFSLADSLLREGMAGWSPNPTSLSVQANQLENADSDAISALDKAKKRLNLTWARGKAGERFAKFQALDSAEKAAIFAFCVSRGITSHLSNSNSTAPALMMVTEQLKPDFRRDWTPTKDTYFKRIKAQQLVAIGEELLGQDWAAANKNTAKKLLVEAISGLFTGETPAEDAVKEKVARWTPPGF